MMAMQFIGVSATQKFALSNLSVTGYTPYDTTEDDYLSGKALSTGAFSSGRMIGSSFTMDAASEFNAYFVVLSGDGKGIYFSDAAAFDIQAVGTSTAIFGDQSSYSSSFKAANSTYSGSGWYAVPEPTSGLLFLIGAAGLARALATASRLTSFGQPDDYVAGASQAQTRVRDQQHKTQAGWLL